MIGNEAPICVQRSQALADSFSYPSGHATQGWAYALILASLVPEKATPILARGRAYGESRIVCGVHWLSDVAAGRLTGTAVFAALTIATQGESLARSRGGATAMLRLAIGLAVGSYLGSVVWLYEKARAGYGFLGPSWREAGWRRSWR